MRCPKCQTDNSSDSKFCKECGTQLTYNKFSDSDRTINTWKKFLEVCGGFDDRWVFRGQSSDDPLTTTLERACKDYGIELEKAPGLEEQLIRDFRRRYRGDDLNLVLKDTLYCLAMLQQYGAPTRLLDWTYSPLVAAYFALEKSVSSLSVVWCLNCAWCGKRAREVDRMGFVKKRYIDKTRNDTSFIPLYMAKPHKKFVFPENAYQLNERLIIQRGVFLCPADISVPFEDNLKKMNGWRSSTSIVKLCFKMNKNERLNAIKELRYANVGHATLFPGLDGFAKSLKLNLPFYGIMAKIRAGQKDYK